jgi:transposase
MGKAIPFSATRVRELEASLEERWARDAFLRFQCVWLRHQLDLTATEISQALLLSVSTVRRIHAEFVREGRSAIEGKGNRGGRRRGYLTLSEEVAFLREHSRKSKDGKIRNVSELKRDYEDHVGRTVHKTTLYRMLERHGWRKVAPRTFHTKRDPGETAVLKKTLR